MLDSPNDCSDDPHWDGCCSYSVPNVRVWDVHDHERNRWEYNFCYMQPSLFPAVCSGYVGACGKYLWSRLRMVYELTAEPDAGWRATTAVRGVTVLGGEVG